MLTNDDNGGDQVRHARDSSGNVPEEGFVRTLSELARELQAEPDMASLLNHIVEATVAEIGGADYGGITLKEGRKVRAVAATDPMVERLDEAQDALGEGPCISSLTEKITVRSDDFDTEQRWPRFVAAARDEGVASMLSVQLFVEGDNLGALNLYSCTPNVFAQVDEYTAMALASHAAVAMKGSSLESNLRQALLSRDAIGQGKGILMERYKIDAEEAFRLLVVASQKTHRRLREVADHLTATGELRTD